MADTRDLYRTLVQMHPELIEVEEWGEEKAIEGKEDLQSLKNENDYEGNDKSLFYKAQKSLGLT